MVFLPSAFRPEGRGAWPLGELASPTAIVRRAVRTAFHSGRVPQKYALRSASVRFAALIQRLRHSLHAKPSFLGREQKSSFRRQLPDVPVPSNIRNRVEYYGTEYHPSSDKQKKGGPAGPPFVRLLVRQRALLAICPPWSGAAGCRRCAPRCTAPPRSWSRLRSPRWLRPPC